MYWPVLGDWPVTFEKFRVESSSIVRQKNIYMLYVPGFSSEKTRYGRSALSFYFIEIFYIEIVFFTTFLPIFQHIRQYFAYNSQ